jgi:hypothetical protein
VSDSNPNYFFAPRKWRGATIAPLSSGLEGLEMASEKVVKLGLAAAMIAVVLGVAGYVMVFWHNYQGCQQLEAEAAKNGKPMSCADIKAAAKAQGR